MGSMRDLILELRAALSEWKKTPDGYEMDLKGRTAKLFRKPKKRGKGLAKDWYLSYHGKEYPLGKRASFDHAEGKLKEILGA